MHWGKCKVRVIRGDKDEQWYRVEENVYTKNKRGSKLMKDNDECLYYWLGRLVRDRRALGVGSASLCCKDGWYGWQLLAWDFYIRQVGRALPAPQRFKRISSMIADKTDQPYHSVIRLIRCKLTFSLLRSTITCLRGSRSSSKSFYHKNTIADLALIEGRVCQWQLSSYINQIWTIFALNFHCFVTRFFW